jgi:hypothetical protein
VGVAQPGGVRARLALGVLVAVATLGGGWPTAVGAAGQVEINGTWIIEITRTSYTETGVRDPDNGGFVHFGPAPFVFTCSGDTCTVTPNITSFTTVTRTGPATWSAERQPETSSPCVSDNFDRLTIDRQGDRLVGSQHRANGIIGSANGGGPCANTSTARHQEWTYDIVGALPVGATTAPSTTSVAPTTTTSLAAPGSGVLGRALTERQQDAAAAVARGDRSLVPAALVSPAEAFSDAGRVAQNALLAATLVLLLVFPSQLFNSTWEQNHERIERTIRRIRRAQPPAEPGESTRGRIARAARFLAVAVVGAIIAGFLDPDFGFNQPSAALVLGVLLSILIALGAAGLAGVGYRRARGLPVASALAAVPAGLIIAAGCVVISRLVDFRPGYLYGLVGGLAFGAALDQRDEGRAELATLYAGLVIALAAWLAFGPVSTAANKPSPGFITQTADGMLSGLFIGGIEGLLFGLLPLRFLPGHRVARWSWVAWGLTAGVASFVFVNVLLRPESGYLGTSTTASVAVTYGLFVGFGVASVLFWAWFRLRREHEPTA